MRSPWHGAPRWLLLGGLFEAVMALHYWIVGDLLELAVTGLGAGACVLASALTVRNRVDDEERQRRHEQWLDRLRDG